MMTRELSMDKKINKSHFEAVKEGKLIRALDIFQYISIFRMIKNRKKPLVY